MSVSRGERVGRGPVATARSVSTSVSPGCAGPAGSRVSDSAPAQAPPRIGVRAGFECTSRPTAGVPGDAAPWQVATLTISGGAVSSSPVVDGAGAQERGRQRQPGEAGHESSGARMKNTCARAKTGCRCDAAARHVCPLRSRWVESEPGASSLRSGRRPSEVEGRRPVTQLIDTWNVIVVEALAGSVPMVTVTAPGVVPLKSALSSRVPSVRLAASCVIEPRT